MTRDPARIDRMLALLREAWMRSPDLRLSQVVDYACSRGGFDGDDVFYCEDDVAERGLREAPEREP